MLHQTMVKKEEASQSWEEKLRYCISKTRTEKLQIWWSCLSSSHNTYIKYIITMKSSIYVSNNCYKNNSSSSTMEWVLWEIDNFKVFDLWGAHFLLSVLVLEVRVRKYYDNSEIAREIYQDWDLKDRVEIES